MLKNYLKIAFRNLWKQKINSAISIGGLAVGLACCILLILYVRFEWSYDAFHEESDRIYRVVKNSTQPNSGEINQSVSSPYPMASELESTFPEVESAIRLSKMELQMMIDNRFSTEEVLLADSGFFNMFSFGLTAGNAESVLSDPGGMVLTERKAEQLFGHRDVIGETLTVRFPGYEHVEERVFTVSGIAESPPGNSSIQFEIVLPYETYLYTRPADSRSQMAQNWFVGYGQTWLLLHQRESAEEMEIRFPEFMLSHYPESFIENQDIHLWLQPFEDVYYNEAVSPHFNEQGNILYSRVLAGIALVVLIIASCNFISLTMSRASERGHEIGLRKSAGANNYQLIRQLLGEVFLTYLFAFGLGVILAELFLPAFQWIVQKPVSFDLFGEPVLWGLFAVLLFVSTLLTGLYPALAIAKKNASDLFRSPRSAGEIPLFVKSLIGTQFALSITFLIAAFAMQNQFQFLLNKDLGFSPNRIIAVETASVDPDESRGVAEIFSRESEQVAGVEQVSKTSMMFMEGYGWGGMRSHGTNLEEFRSEGGVNIEFVDEHFFDVMGIELLQGENYSPEQPQNIHEGIIVNRSFVEAFGMENPVGTEIQEENQHGFFYEPKRIVGVVEDYHFRPLQFLIEPLVIRHLDTRYPGDLTTLLVKIEEGMTRQVLAQLTDRWNELFPEETFSYSFMDERIARFYEEEQRWSNIIQASSTVAILLACFGLFGLASLAAQRRTKEIGIRKVMGATVANIMLLLNRDFLKLVLIGFLIAIPFAWIVMNRWLEGFAYRIDIGPGVFLLAGLAAVFIALATVSWQSVRAAVANPVDSLRSE